jgi:hypothetical protein
MDRVSVKDTFVVRAGLFFNTASKDEAKITNN